MEIKEKDIKDDLMLNKVTKKEIKNQLKNMLFECCEDWIIKGQAPDFEFK